MQQQQSSQEAKEQKTHIVRKPGGLKLDKHTPYQKRYGYKTWRLAVERRVSSFQQKHKRREL